MLSESWINELISKNDIASVISEYTTLTPKGGKLWACCPFHHEKTPSFKVDTTTQLFYCFGCHKGGNVISFIKEKENLSGIEAMKYLADRAGMLMPDSGYSKEEAEREKAFRMRLFNANRDAARFYFAMLKKNNAPLEYLTKKRNLSPEIITRFGLGFAPDSWNSLCNYLKEKGYTDDELVAAGLAKRNKNGVFDFFRNRVIFPIIDEKGNVLAFGGRTMGDDKPKYLNTGDTPIYNKRSNLYSINMLPKGTQGDIVLVEGYMDVISLYAAGVENAVASLGTALTQNQAKLLKRRTNRIYVSYDGDGAGQAATLRGLDILADEQLEVKVIMLPEGQDPDDFARANGKEGYMKLKENALALNTFKIEHMAKRFDMNDADSRQSFAIEACKLAATFQPVERERYYDLISQKTGISTQTLSEQGQKSGVITEKRNNYTFIRNNKRNNTHITDSEQERFEITLAACAASEQKAAIYILANADALIKSKEVAEFLHLAVQSFNETGTCNSAGILSMIEGNTANLAAALSDASITQPLSIAKDCIRRRKLKDCNESLMSISRKLDMHEINIDEYKQSYEKLAAQISALKQEK